MVIDVWSDGYLDWRERRYRCSLGSAGVTANKREGNRATPAGEFPLRRVLYRADRIARPRTDLPISELTPLDGWCDDPTDRHYNRQVPLPYPARCEALWREDEIYDLIVVLGHNDDPPRPGLGSAIFLHVARPGYTPTEGCVAVALADLLEMLAGCGKDGRIRVHLDPAPIEQR
ncbi:MAG: L,D-transpeptidase family protein [Alphaproteobacteria bacterium]|nr:L,D-transpeptidase family protein [Alphaproteobacteria bacterium]